jgi:tRNA pseudouridine55 synthase
VTTLERPPLEKQATDGVLIVDKPTGWTSHDVVAKVRNITRIKKVGHTGTLDPFATGVLPLTLGRATRLTNYFLSSDKVYRGAMRFGFATNTFDLDGEPTTEITSPRLDAERLQQIFAGYVGTIHQTLPPFSAKKVHGKPLYSYARRGIEMEAGTKEVRIHFLRLLEVGETEVEFELGCAAGTYARSLAHDIGRDYGSGAHLVRLCRTRSGEFPLDAALALVRGSEFPAREALLEKVIPLSKLLPEMPSIVISSGDRGRVLHGMDLNLLTSAPQAKEYRLLDEAGDLVAIAERIQTFASPVAQPAHWVRIHPRIMLG